MTNTTPDDLRTVADRWMEEGRQKGDAEAAIGLCSPDFVDHDPDGRKPDREGHAEGIRQLYSAFPDFRAVIEDRVIDTTAGKVTVRWSATGTHRGTLLSVPPTGRLIAFKGIEIIRIEGGLIVERWGEWDGISLLEQLGRLGA
jgi:steroid delta-isomerase-like uncharacterized protein